MPPGSTMRSLSLAACLLALPASAPAQARTAAEARRAAQRPNRGFCEDLFRDVRVRFEDGRSVYPDRQAKPPALVFCRADGLVSKQIELRARRLGQSTGDAKAGLFAIAYEETGKRGRRLDLFDSSGTMVASLKTKALNATFWGEGGLIKAGSPVDGLWTLSRDGKILKRELPAKAGAKDGAAAGERAPL